MRNTVIEYSGVKGGGEDARGESKTAWPRRREGGGFRSRSFPLKRKAF